MEHACHMSYVITMAAYAKLKAISGTCKFAFWVINPKNQTISGHNINPGHNNTMLGWYFQVQIAYLIFISRKRSVCGMLALHSLCSVCDEGKKITVLVLIVWVLKLAHAAVFIYRKLGIDFARQTYWVYNQNRVSLPGCANKIFFPYDLPLSGMSS